MRRFKFEYLDGDKVKWWFSKVRSHEEAKRKFRELKGDKVVLSIEEVTEDRLQYVKR